MPRFIADFHIHSKYSRATSPEMDVEHLSRFAEIKGIALLGTGDFTHPFYLAELKEKLQPLDNGLFLNGNTRFILTAEVCNNFYSGGSGKRMHTLIFAPGFETAERINARLQGYGKLGSDGRPQLKLSARDLLTMVLDIDERCLVVPAHIWTPWFSLLGANAGFDSAEECFGDLIGHIHAVETGLSSDPPMNWRLSQLDRFCLLSNSDAHSPAKIGREANLFETELDYDAIMTAIKTRDNGKFLRTLEFFPQEGKYHYDGHRKCDVVLSPRESMRQEDRCPQCGQRLTIGVMHRVEELADRPEGYVPPGAIPCEHLVPLAEIIAEATGKGVDTVTVRSAYDHLIQRVGSEFQILMDVPEERLRADVPERIGQGILRMRKGQLHILPGYDGVFGQVRLFEEEGPGETRDQLNLF